MPEPRSDLVNVFLGSSSEGLPLAKALQLELGNCCVPHGWWNVFGDRSGITNVDQLLDLMRHDFAVLILSPDDQLLSRERQVKVPRDNLIFELGLFIGVFGGLDRAIFLVPDEAKLPSDLLGIPGLKYRLHLPLSNARLEDLRTIISPAATRIADTIKRLGPRQRPGSSDSVGVTSHVLFHPVIQFTKDDRLRFKIGYSGEGMLYDATFKLFHVMPTVQEDGSPWRKWTELQLVRTYIPEIRFSFHVSHRLDNLQLPGKATTFEAVRQVPGVFHLTVRATDSSSRRVRNRRVYAATQIKKGQFASLNDEDLSVDSWINDWEAKPALDWARFEKFEPSDE